MIDTSVTIFSPAIIAVKTSNFHCDYSDTINISFRPEIKIIGSNDFKICEDSTTKITVQTKER